MTVIASGKEILELIPQRPPMVMIDSLYSVSEVSAQSGLTILKENIFLRDDKLAATGLIENIAQTAAAMAGHYFKSTNKEVKTGFIGSIKSLEIFSLPSVNSEITTTITQIQEVMDIKIIKGEVYLESQLIAQCELKIFLIDKPESN